MASSGHIRQSLASLKRHLNARLERGTQALNRDIPNEPASREQLWSELHEVSSLLVNSVASIQASDGRWVDFISSLTDKAAIDAEQKIYTDHANSETGYMNSIAAAENMISRLESCQKLLERRGLEPVQPPAPQNSAVGGGLRPGAGGAQQQRPANLTIKPPKISLPEFEGDVLKWREFWSLFCINIHDRPELSKAEKFSYLHTSVKGVAKKAIGGILVEEQFYDDAVALLKERFDRASDQLVPILHSSFRNIQQCGNRRDQKWANYDECEQIFRQLKALGEDVDRVRSMSFDYLAKFPAIMVAELFRFHGVNTSSALGDLRKAVHKSITETETQEVFMSNLQSMQKGGADSRKESKLHEGDFIPADRATNSSLAAISDQRNASRPQVFSNQSRGRGPLAKGAQGFQQQWTCYMCGGQHSNSKCDTYRSGQERSTRIWELGRCGKCGRSGHYKVTCPYSVRCDGCDSDQHTTFMCFKEYPQRFPSNEYPQRFPSNAQRRPPQYNTPPLSKPQRSAASTKPEIDARRSSQGEHAMTTLNGAANHQALFQTATTEIVNPLTGDRVKIRLGLDSLSNRSYITDEAAKKLNLEAGPDDRLRISVFGSSKSIEVPTHRVKFAVQEQNGNLRTIQANTTRIISESSVLPSRFPEKETTYLQGVGELLADDPFAPGGLDVLIGADYAWDFIVGSKKGNPTCPSIFFIPTTLGLMLGGKLETNERDDEAMMLCISCDTHAQFPSELSFVAQSTKLEPNVPDVDEYWELEKVGLSERVVTDEDKVAQENFDRTVMFEDGRYQVTWPFIEERKALLPTNEEVAQRRFNSLARRLQSDEGLLKAYRDTIKLQLERGIIEKVDPSQYNTSNLTHYLPHHPVVKESSATTKIRIVYDASSKQNPPDYSLNECLLRGPIIMPDLCQLLIRFRTHRFAIMADIEKAYLQVGLQEAERDFTRFLWYENDENPGQVKGNVAQYRFMRVPFGIISSAFLLASTCIYHLKQQKTPRAKQIAEDQYVDNVASGEESERDAVMFYLESKQVYATGGMNLQEFCSNSEILMQSIQDRDRVMERDMKVLGLKWDSAGDDTLRLNPPSGSGPWNKSPARWTKRAILKAVAAIFDPLGLFQPALFPAKLLLQKIWLLKYGWDDPVHEELLAEWLLLRKNIETIFEIRIPRRVGKVGARSTLLIFCDASKKGFGAVAYLRQEEERGANCQLIFAKSRLNSPDSKTNPITLPRLELLGCVIGCNLASFCREGLKSKSIPVHFFTDSECVLHWLRSPSPLKQYVERRVEMLRNMEFTTFHYVASADNPADLITRGVSGRDLKESKIWWHGPDWARLSDAEWPIRSLNPVSDEALRESAKKRTVDVSHTLAVNAQIEHGVLGMKIEKYSQLLKLVRVTGFVLKFLKQYLWNKLSDNAKSRYSFLRHVFERVSEEPYITVGDTNVARTVWVVDTQRKAYSKVIECIAKQKKHSLIQQLGLVLQKDSGILRTNFRIENADIRPSSKNPILLPKDEHFTWLTVMDMHIRLHHVGVSHTLSEIRQYFWIPQGRHYVRRVLRKCQVCRLRKTAKPFALPDMPPWPFERVQRSVPFQYCGIDYFGPITVKVDSERKKMWVSLFSCLTVRAVHLEPVVDCSAKEFLLAFIRFVSRRGAPAKVFSDNAGQFKLVSILGDLAWKQVPTDTALLSYLAQNGISWKFIPELAPWQGGHYERMVGIVKSVLRTAIGRRLLTWTDFITLLTETESIVNTRPLTYVPDDGESQSRVLRPVDFLTGQPNLLPSGDEIASRGLGDSGKRLVTIWKERRRYLDILWKDWYGEYLLALRERGNRCHKQARGAIERKPVVGEIVLVREETMPRGTWKLARIIRLIISSDQQIRAAEVKFANSAVTRRPLNLLIPLECSAQSEEDAVATTPRDASLSRPGTRAENEDDDDFSGFSAEDVERAIQALQRFDTSEDEA